MTNGYSLTEIAKELGQPVTWVSEKLASLRNELLLASGLFFPLADHEYEALRESIRTHGIQHPILIGEHITLIDGRHRLLIANELGIDAPAIFLQGLTLEQERDLSYSLNTARRQLTRAQKRTLVETELMRDPARSDRLIASVCGVSHVHVADIRREITTREVAAQAAADALVTTTTGPLNPAVITSIKIDLATEDKPATATVQAPRRVGRDGITQTVKITPRTIERPPPSLGYVICEHGQAHQLFKTIDGYRLEADRD